MIAIGCDHGGYELKQKVVAYLESKNIPYEDMGCGSQESCDYPVFADALCKKILAGEAEAKGVIPYDCIEFHEKGYIFK